MFPVPTWAIYTAAAGAVALTVALGYSRFEVAGLETAVAQVREALSTEKADRAKDVARAADAARQQEAAHRATEQRWAAQQQEAELEAQSKIAAARADAAAAAGAAGRLRERLAALGAAARRAPDGAPAPAECAPAVAAGDLLADVLERTVGAAREIAAHADAARAAGETCIQSWPVTAATREPAP